MPLSRLLSTLFTDAAADPESPSGPGVDSGSGSRDEDENQNETRSEDRPTTVLHECRNCGTNVDAEATTCPACDGDDIVTYTID